MTNMFSAWIPQWELFHINASFQLPMVFRIRSA